MARIDGIALGAIAAGGVLAWAGIKGYSVPHAIQSLVQGRAPSVKGGQITGTSGDGGGAGGGGAPGGTIGPGAAAAQKWARDHLADYGWGPEQMLPLISLWSGESGWRWDASNGGSGPDSGSAYGIPQSLPGSKMASMGADWRTNPVTQMRWGLTYIKETYGSPANAWGKWQSRNPHWY
jgi:hypothetical protein